MKKEPEKNTELSKSVEYLRAQDEAKDNTRITRYVFLLAGGFLLALFATYFRAVAGEGESLLSSELVHFIAGSLFTMLGVIVDRYFKAGAQKETEKDMAYLVGKLKQEDQKQKQQGVSE